MTDSIKLPSPKFLYFEEIGELHEPGDYAPSDCTALYTAEQLRAAVEADRARRQPTWDDLQQLAAKHGAWISGYGPFAVELLATYGVAPEKQPHWVQQWLNAEASVRRHHQPAQQPLTDEQMWKLWNKQGSDEMTQQEAITFARAIEQAHGIGAKND